MRKILYSPSYGAGWVSWSHLSREAKEFMLTYQPLIDAVDRGDEITVEEDYQYKADDGDWDILKAYKKLHPALEQFVVDFRAKFPNEDVPYLGGARDLKVAEVSGPVRITEYDGFESIEYLRDIVMSNDWI